MNPTLPHSLNTHFSEPNLKTGFELMQKGKIENVAFFRNGYACDIQLEKDKTFTPVITLERYGADFVKISYFFCSCSAHLRKKDLCHHIAALLFFISQRGKESSAPIFLSDRFQTSIWQVLGRSFFDSFKNEKITHELIKKEKNRAIIMTEKTGVPPILKVSCSMAKNTREDMSCFLSIYPAKDLKLRRAQENPWLNKEKLLKKLTLTQQESDINSSGYKTHGQMWEDSFWHRWAKSCFESFGDSLDGFSVSHDEKNFIFKFQYKEMDFSMGMLPVNSAVEKIIRQGYRALFTNYGYSFHEEGAELSFKIEFSPKNDLLFTPVIAPCKKIQPEFLKRRDLEKWRFGKYFFIHELNAFISLKPAGPFFADPGGNTQASLGFFGGYSPSPLGIPTTKETILPQSQIMEFLEKHRDELGRMRKDLVPPNILHESIMELDKDTTFNVKTGQDDWFYLSVIYKSRKTEISFWDIWKARKAGEEFLLTGDSLVKISGASLAWLDKLTEKSFTGKTLKKRIRVSPLEYLKMRFSMNGNISCSGDDRSINMVKMLEEFKPARPAPGVKRLGMQLYDFQKKGYKWLWFLYQSGFGGLLCDDMGLGKTHQAMALIRSIFLTRKNKSDIALVVTPTSLLHHWKDKLDEYLPNVRSSVYHGPDRVLDAKEPGLIITSYAILRNDIDLFREHSFHVFILDEIQIIKNKATSTYQALVEVKRDFAVGLTGTPIENSVAEIKNLLDFVLPGYLPGQSVFDKQFARPIEDSNDPDAKERLQKIIRPFVLRRTKGQVLKDLPGKIEDKRYCLLTEDQVKLYKDILDTKATDLLLRLESGDNIPYIHIFAALNYLKQICNHPAMLSGDPAEMASLSSGKWELFCEMLGECMDSGLKVVVFSQYVKMLKLMEFYLRGANIGYTILTGASTNRSGILKRFREDAECKVFLASLKAGGLGIDLTAASVVIHYDRWWNQAREDQATDRVHRKGQTKGVQVLKLITRGTLEEKIDKLLRKKEDIAGSLVKEDHPKLDKQFTRDELKSLLIL